MWADTVEEISSQSSAKFASFTIKTDKKNRRSSGAQWSEDAKNCQKQIHFSFLNVISL
jgi:hypothetical protein